MESTPLSLLSEARLAIFLLQPSLQPAAAGMAQRNPTADTRRGQASILLKPSPGGLRTKLPASAYPVGVTGSAVAWMRSPTASPNAFGAVVRGRVDRPRQGST